MLISPDFFSGLLTVVLLDLLLAGDNAMVIALAARDLPRSLQTRAIFWGSCGAVAVRLLLTGLVVYLLKLPGLMLTGGILLLPIAWSLLKSSTGKEHKVSTASTFWMALRTIVVADALMGLDNVLAIAGAADGQMLLVMLGLLISVPLVVWGSTLVLRVMQRYPFIVYVGAAAIACTAGRMITDDHLWRDWFDAHALLKYGIDAALITSVCVGGWLLSKTRRSAS